MATGEPVARYVAASSLQNEMQATLKLGVVFCVLTLWWGFRPSREELGNRRARLEGDGMVWNIAARIYAPLAVGFATGIVLASQYGSTVGFVLGLFTTAAGFLWGFRPLGTALLTTIPIIIVVVWLYGLIAAMGYGLNMVTVAIATLSLGVGIDYVIHVVERFREERYKGIPILASIAAVGGASGLALFGSAASDVLGFLIISQSRMGFFSLFGTFSAAMIFFSLIASLVLACGLIGVLNYRKVLGEHREDREMSA
jgi:multidrug efflux pump subunit AcrB